MLDSTQTSIEAWHGFLFHRNLIQAQGAGEAGITLSPRSCAVRMTPGAITPGTGRIRKSIPARTTAWA